MLSQTLFVRSTSCRSFEELFCVHLSRFGENIATPMIHIFCCERIFWWVDCPTCVFISSPFFSPIFVSKATQSKTVMKNMRKMEKLNQHLENCSGAKRTSCKLMICYFLPLILSRQIYCCIPLCVHSFCLYIQALPMCVRMNKNLYLLNLTILLRRL